MNRYMTDYHHLNMRTLTATLTCLIVGIMTSAMGASYHVDSRNGDDTRDGLSPQTAWSTLEKASGGWSYKGGDRILLKRGSTFKGKLALKGVKAVKDAPLSVDAYGEGKELPKIVRPAILVQRTAAGDLRRRTELI